MHLRLSGKASGLSAPLCVSLWYLLWGHPQRILHTQHKQGHQQGSRHLELSLQHCTGTRGLSSVQSHVHLKQLLIQPQPQARLGASVWAARGEQRSEASQVHCVALLPLAPAHPFSTTRPHPLCQSALPLTPVSLIFLVATK